MRTYLVWLALSFLSLPGLQAQQLPARSPFGAGDFCWNPAMTAVEHEWETGILHHQDWTGFEDAPQSTLLYAQYPFVKENSSLGGYFLFDEIRPIRHNMLALSYAYKLRFGPRRRASSTSRQEAQLSLGLSASMSHIFIDGADYLARDPNDPLQPIGELDEFKPNVSVGVFFASRPTGPQKGSYFFAGAAAQQLLPQDISLRETSPAGNLRRVLHGNATIGYRSVGAQLTLEPSLWLDFASRNLSNSTFNLRVERARAFWGGLSYSFNQTVGVQLGYALPGSFTDGDTLRMGLLGTFNVGGTGTARGLGYGFYLGYRLKA
jgi:type IX secretion system PorP/SprF family membrane protein